MNNCVLLDNDVVLKTCCYNAVDEVLAFLTGRGRQVRILGAAQFVLGKRIAKGRDIANSERAAVCLARILERVNVVESSDDEISLAAEFEAYAQSNSLSLESGESLLLAVLVKQSALLLLTGDKRAIRSISPVAAALELGEKVTNRVACLEQMALSLVGQHGASVVQGLVCQEEGVDKALAICFSCASGNCDLEAITSKLTSYISDLRRNSEQVLIASDDLSAVISQEDGIR